VHVPALPETSHASHWPAQALSQQTPSTQWPLPHSLSALHVVASGLLQVPAPFALHTNGEVHDATEQHTPLVQCPLAHSPSPPHTVPSTPFVTHVPAQWYPVAQSALEAHVPLLHAVAPHT
jgi:hypothetical protein